MRPPRSCLPFIEPRPASNHIKGPPPNDRSKIRTRPPTMQTCWLPCLSKMKSTSNRGIQDLSASNRLCPRRCSDTSLPNIPPSVRKLVNRCLGSRAGWRLSAQKMKVWRTPMPGVLVAVAFALVGLGGLECKVLNYIFFLDKTSVCSPSL